MSAKQNRGTPNPPTKHSQASRSAGGRETACDDSHAPTTKNNRPDDTSSGWDDHTNWGSLAYYLLAAPKDVDIAEVVRAWKDGDDPKEVWD